MGKDCYAAVKNEIAMKYKEEKEKNSGRLEEGLLDKIIADVSKKRNLAERFVVTKDSIRKRIKRGSLTTYSRGPVSPLESLETVIVTLLIQMARIRQCLTPACDISLINSLISESELSKDLVE